MLTIPLRVPIITLLTFFVALIVSVLSHDYVPSFLSAPYELVLSIGCSVFLVCYYFVECLIAFERKV